MRPIYLISLLFLFFWGSQLRASSFEICEYKLKVLAVSKTTVKVEILETIVSPGFNAQTQSLACQGKIVNDQIPLSKISAGQPLAKKGTTVKAEWRSYSAMTPKGPMSSTSWKFYKYSN